MPKPQPQSQCNRSGACTAEDEPRKEKVKKVTNTDVAHSVRSLERVTQVPELCSDILNKYPPHPALPTYSWPSSTHVGDARVGREG
jgi:hypothetical protein